jgi:hypothetical protein
MATIYPNAIVAIELNFIKLNENDDPVFIPRKLQLRFTDGAWYMHQMKMQEILKELNPELDLASEDAKDRMIMPAIEETLAIGIWAGIQWIEKQRDITIEDIINCFDSEMFENGEISEYMDAVTKAMGLSNEDGTPLSPEEAQKKIAKILMRVMMQRGMTQKTYLSLMT